MTAGRVPSRTGAAPAGVRGTGARIDGRAKVTGQARYTGDRIEPGTRHAVLVGATIARGRIRTLETSEALRAPGVELVLTAANRGPLGQLPDASTGMGWPDQTRPPLADDEVHHHGQTIAVVVADTPERARYAAGLVRADYLPSPFAVRIADASVHDRPERTQGEQLQVERGDPVDRSTAPVLLDETYHSPGQHPCAMEPHATVAEWPTERTLLVRNTTQWVAGNRVVLAAAFGLEPADVQVEAPFVGGMFGSKIATAGHTLLAAVAARRLGRPVAVVLTRDQVLTTVGHRSATVQRIALAARRDGTLLALRHDTTAQAAAGEPGGPAEFHEPTSSVTRLLYAVPRYAATHVAARLDVPPPGWMRAPGEATGLWALESAMDELAVRLGIDPVELRVRNHADRDPHHDLPWSAKRLLECYRRGATAFGWPDRPAEPGSLTDGDTAVGWGMATATYPVWRFGSTVEVSLELVGGAVAARVSTAGSEVGNGAYTMLATVAATELGIDRERVTVRLGDTRLPPSSQTGGSSLTASTAPAVVSACAQVRAELARRAGGNGSTLPELLAAGPCTATASTEPLYLRDGAHSFQSFGAHFVEVRVRREIGQVRVSRVSSVFDIGRVLSPRTVRAQLSGAIVFGIGQALHEQLVPDPVAGGRANADLAGYLVPVHADVPRIDVDWIGEPDPVINELGARGAGEIGITGLAAAIANAVHHATGVRVRSLPIGPADLL